MDVDKKNFLLWKIHELGGKVYGQDLARRIERRMPEWSAKTINRDLYRLKNSGDLLVSRGYFRIREWCPLMVPTRVLLDSEQAFSKGGM